MGQIMDKIKDWVGRDVPGKATQGLPTGTPVPKPTPPPTQTDVSLDSVTNTVIKRKKLLEEASKP
jgi:hypothetical protein